MNIFSTSFNYKSRLEKVRKLMDEKDIDVLLVNIWPNQYYLSGQYQHAPWYPIEVNENTETPLIIFRDKKKEPIFLITYLTGNGTKEGTWIKDVRIIDREPYGKKRWNEYVADVLKDNGVEKGTIGIEKEVCVLSTFEALQSALPKAKFVDSGEIFSAARIVKEPEEIQLIKESVAIAEAGLLAGMKAAKVGVLESEVQKVAEIEMKRKGAIREIETMVQSGIRTANHRCYGANWKKIGRNELVTIDIGCVYKGYGSDLTRTWVVGTPRKKHREVADDMLRIRGKVVNIIKPGLEVGRIWEFGRGEMKSAGYRVEHEYLPKGDIGWGSVSVHGVGLGPMHDPPHIFDRDVKLKSGMVIALTCGARFEDFTIRFEDDMVIVPGGVETINKLIPWKL